MKYRKYFGLTWQQYIDTPAQVFFTDLSMIDIESEVRRAQEKKQPKK